jgi:hypothetical protein
MAKRKTTEPAKAIGPPNSSQWSTTWGQRLSVNEQIAVRKEHPEYPAAIVEDPETAERKRILINKFRLGAKQLCAIQMWTQILVQRKIDGLPTPKQAETLGMKPQHVANYAKGDLSFANMIAFLTDTEKELDSLGPLPAPNTRAVAGYQCALAWMKADENRPLTEPIIPETDLLAVLAILGDRHFQERSRENGAAALSAVDWVEIAENVPTEIKLDSVDSGKQMPLNYSQLLEVLYKTWGEAVREIHEAIPHRWMKEKSK